MEVHTAQSKKRSYWDSHDHGSSVHFTNEEEKLIHTFGELGKALCNLLSAASEVENIQRCIGGEEAVFVQMLKARVDGGGFGWVGKFDVGKRYRLLADGGNEEQNACKKAKLIVDSQITIESHKSSELYAVGADGHLSDNLSGGDEESLSYHLSEEGGASSTSAHGDLPQIGWPPLLQLAAGDRRRQPEKEAKITIMAAEIGFKAFSQAKVLQSEIIEREMIEEAAQAAYSRSETSVLAKAQPEKIGRETAEEATKASKADLKESKSSTAERLRYGKRGRREKKRAAKNAVMTAKQYMLDALAKAQSEKIEREKAEEVGEAEEAEEAGHLQSEALTRDKVTQSISLQGAQKALALALAKAKAEAEEMAKKRNIMASKKAKQADEKKLTSQTRWKIAQQAIKGVPELDYGGPPLQQVQDQPSKINPGQDKANPIIVWDSENEICERERSKIIKDLKAVEVEDVVNNIKAAPPHLSAKQELEKLVNQIDATVIYSRFENRHAVEGGDNDVHVQAILLWRGRQTVVGHAWEISEEAASRKAAETLLTDKHFLQELARMRLAAEKNSGKPTTLLAAGPISTTLALPSLVTSSLPSPTFSVNRKDIPAVANPINLHTGALPDSGLVEAPAEEAGISNGGNFSILSVEENMSSSLETIAEEKQILRVMSPIAPQQEESSILVPTRPEGILGEMGTTSCLPQGDLSLETEALIMEDEILDDAHPTLREPREELSSRPIIRQVKVRAPEADLAVCLPQELPSGGTIQVAEEIPRATSPVVYLPQEDSSSAPPTLQADQGRKGRKDPAVCLLKQDTPPEVEEVVIEDEVLNHADPSFKAARTAAAVKSCPSGNVGRGFQGRSYP